MKEGSVGRFLQNPLHRAGAAAWSVLGILLVLYVLGKALGTIRPIFPPLLLAMILVYALAPLIARMQRAQIPRTLGLVLVYMVFLGTLGAIAFLLVPVITRQVGDLATAVPDLLETFEETALDLQVWLADRGFELAWDLDTILAGAVGSLEDVLGQFGRVTRVLSGTLTVVITLIMGPIIAFYLLADLPRLRISVLRLLPESARDRAFAVGTDVNRAVAGFVRGQLVVAMIVALMSWVALLIIGVPYALIIGLIAGLTNLVPIVGPIVGGILGASVAWASIGLSSAVWVVVAFTVIQQVESQILFPKIVGRAVRIHPATGIVVVFIGAVFAGVWGMLLAVPLVAGLKAAVMRLWFPHLLLPEGKQLDPVPQPLAPDEEVEMAVAEPSADEPALSESGPSGQETS